MSVFIQKLKLLNNEELFSLSNENTSDSVQEKLDSLFHS